MLLHFWGALSVFLDSVWRIGGRHLPSVEASVGEVIHEIDKDAILMYEPVPFPATSEIDDFAEFCRILQGVSLGKLPMPRFFSMFLPLKTLRMWSFVRFSYFWGFATLFPSPLFLFF